jgi:MSHA biogenesis protein MshI
VLARFRRQGLAQGWVAIAPLGNRARVACVAASDAGRPRVQWTLETAWDQPLAALREIKARLGRGASMPLVVLLERGRYQMLPMEAPAVPPEEWRQAARWQIKQMVDYPIETAAVDILTIPAHVTQRGQASLIAVAAPREAMQTLVNTAHEAGVCLQALDIAETALRNVSGLLEEPGRGQALLHVGASHSTLVVTAGGELLLSRGMEVSLAQLTHADADIRQQAFERTSLELQRTLDSFERVFSQVSLSRVLVTPAQAVEDFLTYLRELIYVPVTALDLGAAFDLAGVPDVAADPQLQSQCLAAFGAALRPGATA